MANGNKMFSTCEFRSGSLNWLIWSCQLACLIKSLPADTGELKKERGEE